MQLTAEIDGIRLDQFLVQQNIAASRSIAARMCDAGAVKVNGQVQAKKYKLQAGDIVEYVEAEEEQAAPIKAEKIHLNIKYEDDDIIVLSKQAGLVCHPATGHATGTLVNALIDQFGAENLANIQGDENRLGIVHRLDADTSGLMVIAKTDKAGVELQKAMKEHSTNRHYIALVHGHLKYNTGKIECPLIRTIGRNNRPRMSVSDNAKAKYALTTFEVKEHFDDVQIAGYKEPLNFTMLDCKIHTGRTHQIRSHMEYIGFPVVGDNLYTKGVPTGFNAEKHLHLNRQFLHSYQLGFEHPITHEQVQFADELPKELQIILNKIKENSQ